MMIVVPLLSGLYPSYKEIVMSICSRHQVKEVGCSLCEVNIVDISGVQDKLTEAVASGIYMCSKCKFESCNTISICPKCSTPKETVSL